MTASPLLPRLLTLSVVALVAGLTAPASAADVAAKAPGQRSRAGRQNGFVALSLHHERWQAQFVRVIAPQPPKISHLPREAS